MHIHSRALGRALAQLDERIEGDLESLHGLQMGPYPAAQKTPWLCSENVGSLWVVCMRFLPTWWSKGNACRNTCSPQMSHICLSKVQFLVSNYPKTEKQSWILFRSIHFTPNVKIWVWDTRGRHGNYRRVLKTIAGLVCLMALKWHWIDILDLLKEKYIKQSKWTKVNNLSEFYVSYKTKGAGV